MGKCFFSWWLFPSWWLVFFGNPIRNNMRKSNWESFLPQGLGWTLKNNDTINHEHVTKNGRWLSVHSDNHLQVARHERWIFPIWHMKQNKQTWLPLWHAFLQRFWSNHPFMSYHNPTPRNKNKNNWILVEVPISHHITQNIIPNWSQWSWRLGLERSVAIHLHLIRLTMGFAVGWCRCPNVLGG